VVPIPKVRGMIKIVEFRPINKLPIYEKILAVIVHKQLVEYLESNDLLKESIRIEQSTHVKRLTVGNI